MHPLAKLRVIGAPHYGKTRKHGNYRGLAGQGGNWKAHWPQVLKSHSIELGSFKVQIKGEWINAKEWYEGQRKDR